MRRQLGFLIEDLCRLADERGAEAYVFVGMPSRSTFRCIGAALAGRRGSSGDDYRGAGLASAENARSLVVYESGSCAAHAMDR